MVDIDVPVECGARETRTLAITSSNTNAYQRGGLTTCQVLQASGTDGTIYIGATTVE